MNTHVSPRRGKELLRADRAYRSGGLLARLLALAPAGIFHRLLDRIDVGLSLGTIEAHLPDGSVRLLGGRGNGPTAVVHLHSWAALVRLGLSGSVGWYRAWDAEEWASPDPVPLFDLFMRNGETLGDAARARGPLRWVNKAVHALRRNDRRGAKRNIHAHYDLGNDFYRLWLDRAMNYSSALFTDPAQSLDEAQAAKVDAILDRLDLRSGSRLLEIGCGWGALAERAVERHDVLYTGITLSPSQAEVADARLAAIDLSGRSRIEICDYRDAQGPYDAIASVEMVEAVGQAYWPTYLDAIARLLRPGGKAAIQYILINDALFDRYVASSDFIQAYIFPGGCLMSESRFRALAEERGLAWRDVHRFGDDYAETLRQWRERFDAAVAANLLPSGFDDRFARLWRYYLQYCEGGFRGGGIDVAQVTLEKTA
ncbi:MULTISPECIES: cyclopropane-fatty-acyl-phospholipid synthase family protein [unclassified Sphingopyxis]|uniref:cyclopropane-fatty-acyl-phospholipid synthase family protein n=1 Tax=unclassified Sphingopyxis TaxID=2614943 RepID=UPI0028566B51|nr:MULTISPECIES: cyclopropane-fatty-acyl-phospholipid synthase family protein [unclassified Sphingopyxis]MDR6832013.1 cyclopropane-fatty-acyl-phospholipid synthase [Sphingopyxis sp. BE122]MDR7227755.1 cyclopropane-fatty-acyl-phospholipid synthase [Sphingopyxis sp. BE259]